MNRKETESAVLEAAASGKLLKRPYLDWAGDQKVPIVEGFSVDLLTVETEPWDRLGASAAFVNETAVTARTW